MGRTFFTMKTESDNINDLDNMKLVKIRKVLLNNRYI